MNDSGELPRPTVSVGLPVYNGEAFLDTCLRSLLDQTFADFELIVCDNASTDGTREICQRFAAKDARIRYVRSDQNRGAAANYNWAFQLARGTFFRWAAHDDVCHPRFLEACLERFDQPDGDDIVVVQPRTRFIDGAGAHLYDDPQDLSCPSGDPARRFAHVLRVVWAANAIFGLCRREVLADTRLIGTFIASDHVLLAELALRGRLVLLDEMLFDRRIHDEASMRAAKTKRAGLAWFGPRASLASRVLSPSTKVALELVRSSHAAPIARITKLRADAAVAVVYVPRILRITLGRWRRRAVERLRSVLRTDAPGATSRR